MEKPAQTPNGAPHRRRRRRPAGSAPQAQPPREGKAPEQPREPRRPAPHGTGPANNAPGRENPPRQSSRPRRGQGRPAPQEQPRRRHSRSRAQKAPTPARICARHRGLVTSKSEHPPSRTHPLSYAARIGAATCFLRERTPGIQALSPSFKFTPNTSETNCVSPSQMNCEPSARMSVAKNSTNW